MVTTGTSSTLVPVAGTVGAARRIRRWSARRRPTSGRAQAVGRLLAAVVGGLLGYAAFPPVGAWFLAPVSVALLTAAVRGGRARLAFTVSTAYGAATFLPLLVWLRTIGVDAWVGLALIMAVEIGLLGVGLAAVQRLRAWPLWVAALWVTEELVRGGWPLGGFTWGRLAFSQAGGPLVRWAAVGGAPLVTFAVALTGALLVAAVRAVVPGPHRAVRRRYATLGGAAALAAAVAVGGYAVPVPVAGQHVGGAAGVTVALVQGNVPRLGLNAFAQREAVLRNHVAATETFAADVAAGRRPRPDLVVWPENATDIDPTLDPQVGALVMGAVRAVGVPTLVGAVLDGPGPTHVRNSGLVWDPRTGPGDFYVKRHLVPFGEYVPYRNQLGSVFTELRRVPYDFVPGHRAGVLQVGPARVGDVICYEVAYDGLVRSDVEQGARVLVVQTNNATYGDSETQQQLAMGRLRAVEHGRAVLVAATSGISAVIAPDGRVVATSKIFTRSVLDQPVPLRDTLTLADRLGSLPELLLAAVGAAAVVVATWLGRRRRSRRPTP